MSWPDADIRKSLGEIWPEPLIIDLLSENYRGLSDLSARIALARRHAGILRSLVVETSPRTGALRRDLIALCGAAGIDARQIAAGEKAVFMEVARIVVTRFRMSERQRNALAAGLHSGVSRLAALNGAGYERPVAVLARGAGALAA